MLTSLWVPAFINLLKGKLVRGVRFFTSHKGRNVKVTYRGLVRGP